MELGLGRLSTKNHYWLVGNEAAFERTEAKGFRDWLMLAVEEAAAAQSGPFPSRGQPLEKLLENDGYYLLD